MLERTRPLRVDSSLSRLHIHPRFMHKHEPRSSRLFPLLSIHLRFMNMQKSSEFASCRSLCGPTLLTEAGEGREAERRGRGMTASLDPVTHQTEWYSRSPWAGPSLFRWLR